LVKKVFTCFLVITRAGIVAPLVSIGGIGGMDSLRPAAG
jgi:hypothetical protein